MSTSDLAQAMGCSWDEIHEEVEILKHHISERFEDRIDHVADEDGDLLEQRGLLPGATVEVLETCPPDGLLVVAVDGWRGTLHLGRAPFSHSPVPPRSHIPPFALSPMLIPPPAAVAPAGGPTGRCRRCARRPT